MGSSMKIEVIFNGIPRELEIHDSLHVNGLMRLAQIEYRPPSTLGELAFFTRDGRELNIHSTLKAAGLKGGDSLLLRPTVVR